MPQQYIVNGLQAGSIMALVGVGYLLIYRTGKFFHFAHGAVFTWSAYFLILLLGIWNRIPVLLAFAAILLAAAMGMLLELLVYRTLRRRGSSGTSLLIAGLGLSAFLQNIISMIFGDDTLSFRWWPIEPGWSILGARITPTQTYSVLISWLSLLLIWLVLNRLPFGLQMKAVASNPELARVAGINLERTYLWAMGLGSLLAGIAGILTASDVDMTPTMGMQPMMMGVVAVIIGGSTIWGTACGALLLGMAQHVSIIWLPAKWQDAIVFVVLLVFLVFRPQGFFGKSKA